MSQFLAWSMMFVGALTLLATLLGGGMDGTALMLGGFLLGQGSLNLEVLKRLRELSEKVK